MFFQSGIEAIFLHHLQLAQTKTVPMILFQFNTDVCHSLVIRLDRFIHSLFQPAHPGIEVPEGDGNIIDTVHLFQDLCWSAIPSFIAGTKVNVSLSLDGRQHGILDSIIIVSLPDILFNFTAPIGVR